jgi:hypothetical protein
VSATAGINSTETYCQDADITWWLPTQRCSQEQNGVTDTSADNVVHGQQRPGASPTDSKHPGENLTALILMQICHCHCYEQKNSTNHLLARALPHVNNSLTLNSFTAVQSNP